MDRNYDIVIVGTGAAGLYCALNLPDYMNVLMITKETVEDSDSFLAQGGICMMRGESDYEDYYKDTLKAGHYENDSEAVELMIRSSNHVIRDLLRYGVEFERDEDGRLAFTREAAHSQPRILYHEDISGKEITSTLLDRVRERDNITICEKTTMLDIVSTGNVCGGIVVSDSNGNVITVNAANVVFACGGVGGLYKNSTNYPHLTGDAVAIALKHDIEVKDLDYIQIHPTTLFSKKPGRRFLISESVRGEGALLYDKNGERFTDELQPRDLLSAAIREQMEKDGTEYVWEDMRPIGKEVILDHFPNIYEHCLEEGFDVLKEPIPVVPAQHYFMGGIKVDHASRSSMKGLYACGETSCNGVHGKNRLASNSLLESLVFAQRAADDMTFGDKPAERVTEEADPGEYDDLDDLFAEYRENVLAEIEKEKKRHE